jgi:hypothetical protein
MHPCMFNVQRGRVHVGAGSSKALLVDRSRCGLSRLHFFEALREPRYEDYEIQYLHGNRFGFLGNGFSAREFDGSDLTYYMGPDES